MHEGLGLHIAHSEVAAADWNPPSVIRRFTVSSLRIFFASPCDFFVHQSSIAERERGESKSLAGDFFETGLRQLGRNDPRRTGHPRCAEVVGRG
jgi:hypothetical protein